MSEQVYYCVSVLHITEADKADVNAAIAKFCDLVFGKPTAEHDEECANGTERAIEGEGWRGGGRTCEELVEDGFADLLTSRKHLSVEASFTYIEDAPVESMTLGADAEGESIKCRSCGRVSQDSSGICDSCEQ